MFLKKAIFYLNAILLAFNANAQENNIPIGEWRVHLPNIYINSLEVTGSQTYASSTINGFYIDHSDLSNHILSTVNALNDIEISEIKYHKNLGLLLIGYIDGNIDILHDNTTINIDDIKRKNIIGSKKINHIYFHGNLAYISCDFGVCVFDLVRFEIKETYSALAAGGLPNKIYASTFTSDGDSIFLATEKGMMSAKNSPSVNLMDFNNWYTYGAANKITTTNVKAVCTLNNKIFVGIKDDSISYLSGNIWIKCPVTMNEVRSMNVYQGKMLACTRNVVILADNENSIDSIINTTYLAAPSEAVIDENNRYWIGDLNTGTYLYQSNSFTRFVPNSPYTNAVFSLSYFNNNIVASTGAYTNNYGSTGKHGEYYIFNNYQWTNYSFDYTAGFPNVKDLLNSAYNSHDNKLYFASYGFGVLVDNLDNTYNFIDDNSAPFKRALPDLTQPYVFISDVEVDKDGNLWVANSHIPAASDASLHVRKNGTWSSKSFGNNAARYPLEILFDDNNYKWLRLRPDIDGGLIVYDDKNNIFKYLTDQTGQGGLASKSVHAFAKDKNGEIWVGTEAGISIFYNPENIFTSSPSDASSPIFDGFPLLYNESITCIKVDGGNRKWIGTKNGIWLFNDDASEVLANFTIENSPLISNTILDIEINDLTGEVFIATDKGIVSYRGTATEGKLAHSNVKVFPNPVKPDFSGLVGISGLTNDGNVKITDIYGNLIYETQAEGGTAVWNVKNYNGQRAKTGVYLIFSASENGEDTFVAKIAVVE